MLDSVVCWGRLSVSHPPLIDLNYSFSQIILQVQDENLQVADLAACADLFRSLPAHISDCQTHETQPGYADSCLLKADHI